MRVRHISVTGLFGVFNHEIPLQEEGRITIIHGLNGIGKTIILRMIEETLTGKYDLLATIPYERFEMRFDDASKLQVAASGEPSAWQLVFRMVSSDGRVETSGESFTYDLDKESPSSFRDRPWLHELRRKVDVHLLNINRHVTIEVASSADDKKPSVTSARLTPIVGNYSDEIARTIETRRSEYVERSQALDQSFPARVMVKNGIAPLSLEELRRQLIALGEKHDKLSSLGILSPAEIIREVPEEIDSSTLNTLSIYVGDTEKKLGSFDDLAARIDVLTGLVNDRFRFKHFAIHRDQGFVFSTKNEYGGEREVPVTGLSSGEQHELVMFYELLFKTKPDTLVLIDEPEISLHLIWQQEFIDDIAKIVEITGIDVIVATHSPDIAGRHWDWTVALQGPDE